jgi:hypothetical protein
MDGDGKARIHLTGTATEGSSVPAEVLVRAVQGLQQAVWLLAAADEAQPVSKRFKPGADFRKRYTLRLATPEPGSYAIPLSLSDERPQLSVSPFGTQDLLPRLHKVCGAIAERGHGTLGGLVPDSSYRLRLLQEIRKVLPKKGEAWAFGFSAGSEPEVVLTAKDRDSIEEWLEAPEDRRETAVIGQLQRIDFAEKMVVILYPPTHRELECLYREEIEETLLEARRELFQIIGQFVLDDDGHPKRLTDVRSIEPVDLSALSLATVEHAGHEYLLSPPVVVNPSLDEDTQQHFVAEIAEFGICAQGRTRDALLDDIASQIGFLWEEYAVAKESELSEDAIELRKVLLGRLKRK